MWREDTRPAQGHTLEQESAQDLNPELRPLPGAASGLEGSKSMWGTHASTRPLPQQALDLGKSLSSPHCLNKGLGWS